MIYILIPQTLTRNMLDQLPMLGEEDTENRIKLIESLAIIGANPSNTLTAEIDTVIRNFVSTSSFDSTVKAWGVIGNTVKRNEFVPDIKQKIEQNPVEGYNKLGPLHQSPSVRSLSCPV